ncbi:amidohydrolase [Colletotrichum godetiae]|uniref:Amidohydrolase n=1 Tax=Colletotrichum godetiae TaxID=1209918 RepID=A0AAJ0AKW3_9PEZI|nr:amidohydrolase [Colletotrichum godetiae]KAK1675110.1 amidohydrolase [Colletotrichum godetiae]
MTLRKAPALTGPAMELPRRTSPRQWMADSEDAIPEKLIKPWKLPQQNTYIFNNANVVDTAKGRVIKNTSVKISNGLIESVGGSPADSTGNDAIVVDLQGKYLSPGLIDCHVHVSSVPGEAGLNGGFDMDATVSHLRQSFVCGRILSKGFTTVRDTGGATLALKEAIQDGVFPGPRLFIANQALSQTGGHGDRRGAHDHSGLCCGGTSGLSNVVDGVPECIRATREQLRTGADFIKIMVGGGVASPTDRIENTQFTADEIKAISEVARSYGTWVTAHAYTPRAIRHAVENGVTGIEHGNFIDKKTAEFMAENDVWLTPTLVTYDAMASDKYKGFLPPANQQKNQEVLKRGLESLKIAAAAGVTICHGSDLLGPLQAEQSREFGIRQQALSNMHVLQSATVNAARMLRQQDVLGQVKEKFVADLLILNGNPLDDVSILDEPEKNVLAVIKDGRVYTSRWSKLPEDVTEPSRLIE